MLKEKRQGGTRMREKTPQQDMPDLESMASATECTGILPALNADEDKHKGPRARLKRRALKKR